jgi:hypothetical protein
MVPGSYTPGIFDGGPLPVNGVTVVNGKVVTGSNVENVTSSTGSGTGSTGSAKSSALNTDFREGIVGLMTALVTMFL